MPTPTGSARPKRVVKKVIDPLIPPPELALRYVNRKVEGGITDFKMMDTAAAHGWPVLIEGPTGCGKSMMIEAYASKKQRRFASVSCNAGNEPSQFFGKIIPTENPDQPFMWQDGVVTDFVRHGGVLLFNEINFMPERISTSLFSLFDARRMLTLLDHEGEPIEAHPDLLLVCDMNPEYLGTRPLNAAFRNRHTIQSVWDYDKNVEEQLVTNSALLELASKFRDQIQKGEIDTPLSTNMLQEFEALIFTTNYDFAAANFTNHFKADERPVIQQTLRTMEANIKRGQNVLAKDNALSRTNKGFVITEEG